jgi:hypothetical protein
VTERRKEGRKRDSTTTMVHPHHLVHTHSLLNNRSGHTSSQPFSPSLLSFVISSFHAMLVHLLQVAVLAFLVLSVQGQSSLPPSSTF